MLYLHAYSNIYSSGFYLSESWVLTLAGLWASEGRVFWAEVTILGAPLAAVIIGRAPGWLDIPLGWTPGPLVIMGRPPCPLAVALGGTIVLSRLCEARGWMFWLRTMLDKPYKYKQYMTASCPRGGACPLDVALGGTIVLSRLWEARGWMFWLRTMLDKPYNI